MWKKFFIFLYLLSFLPFLLQVFKQVPAFLLVFHRSHYLLENITGDFPDGPVVRNLPASAGNMGLIPGPGESHLPQSNSTHVSQLLRLCSATEAAAIRSLHSTVKSSPN